MLKRILHASDFSPASRSAFTMARVLAKRLGARLILFHAYESVAPLAMGMGTRMMPLAFPASGAIVDRLRATTITTTERGLERLAARARRDGLRVSKRLEAGAPASAIVRSLASPWPKVNESPKKTANLAGVRDRSVGVARRPCSSIVYVTSKRT